VATLHRINYVTSSPYKAEENDILVKEGRLEDGTPVSNLFQFDIRKLPISEPLEIDIQVMVQAEVTKAYSIIRVPCVVEHAGIIFDDFKDKQYPGGLTKPMWDHLGSRFVEETHSAGRRAIARAVVAYCDGMSVQTFVGDTTGTIAPEPRGSRQFYWDSVFIPDDPTGAAAGKTYAEIVDDAHLGLTYKVLNLSQSTRAMLALLEYLRTSTRPVLWE
jgi:inosine/xanthosine triphosphate pyrophosphatase family protein